MLDEQDAIAAAAAFLAETSRQWPDLNVRVASHWTFADDGKLIVPWNTVEALDHGDADAELGGNMPICVDLKTGECRYIDINELVSYMSRGLI
ncbi:hypothetical protein [Dactylosporangium sp. CA-092794]|uniref:hypothetical protein n=1 Tax=Dactylosporangium sp. CA-092794 TaxID=3239929 RepID=UPI003D8FE433